MLNVKPSTIAPALFPLPSIPSVSAAIATKDLTRNNSNSIARLKRYSVFLPPFPFLFITFTEVSPPEIKQNIFFDFLNLICFI